MKIIWSDFANEMLREIHKYYKENASVDIANRIKTDIFSVTKVLLKIPIQVRLNIH